MSFVPQPVEHRAGKLRIWDWPTEGAAYIVGADVSEGVVRDRSTINKNRNVIVGDASLGRDRPDYCAAVVLDRETGEHVATWHGYQEPTDFARTLYAVSLLYNTALLAVEINGPGYAVLQFLSRDLSYPRLYRSSRYGSIRQTDNEVEFGWRTTDPLRAILMGRVMELRDSGWTSRDAKLVRELSTMQFDDAGKPRAKGRDKDDIVFALAIALQARHESLTKTVYETPKSRYTGPDAVLQEHQWEQRQKKARIRNQHGYRSRFGPLR